eukprot:PITA_16062
MKQRHPRAKVIIGGDFNMITSLSEKKGGIRKLNKDSEAFVEFIMSARLIDVQPRSGAFTWNNMRGGERQIASRLDRFLVSENLSLEGLTVYCDILPYGGSDHWPISLTATILGTPRNKPFRFENFWLDHPDFIQLVEKWWQEPVEIRGTKMYKLQGKLKHVKLRIKEWNTKKSRIKWLKEGEQNTKFFHRSALDHRGVNKILSAKNDQGESIENHQDIATLLTEHFNNIAQEPEIDRTEAIGNLIKSIPVSIFNEQNQALSRGISLEEVEEAVKDMPNDKAPGADGFTINFYKAYWDIVIREVWEVVEDSRRSASILKALNSTFLALIPKEEEATTPAKFCPIALCNVLYKIISKVIANRVKPILPGLISEEQSGYVEGRQILDNILLAQEMVHTLQSRKVAGMMMQLDLSKAYDKVSWDYLEAILKAFGFDSHCIRIEQLIRQAKEEGKIKGLQPLPSIPATMHQQFVDDTMLHGSPTVKEAQGYKNILNLFSEASAGRLVLTKAVLQAIPQYLLSIIPAPQGILQQIRSIQRTFLWSSNAEKRKWSLVAWNKICKPKILGGLNLLDPLTINKACGAKLWWKLLKEPNLPWAHHWKAKYAPSRSNQDLIRMQQIPEGSPIWNLARKNRDIIQENSFWEVRNGKTAVFYEDAWQQYPKLEKPELAELQRRLQE